MPVLRIHWAATPPATTTATPKTTNAHHQFVRPPSITIGTDGVVSVKLAGQTAPSQVGTLEISDFINPVGLQPIGENLYIETASSGTAQAGTPGQNGLGQIQQGALEGSNVNVVAELVNMIETQRAYEMNSKAISTSDQMMQYVNNNL